MGITSHELKKRGHIAIAYNIFHSYLNYREHVINTVLSEIQNISKHLINFFDLFHFHYNSTMTEDHSDLSVLSAMGKPMIMHYWGNDVRMRSIASQNNPYVYAEDSPPDDVILERLTFFSSYIRHAIVQDYEVYAYVAPYYQHVHVIPIAINLDDFPLSMSSSPNRKPLIIHAPTNPAFKGTAYIEAAIDRLKGKYDFDYVRIEKMSHQEAAKMYRKADIVVDQILCGSYGLFSVEAMALGKPVIAYIREDLRNKFPPELPIINANPDTVYESIQYLLEQPDQRIQLGKAGRAYVEKYHAKEVVVDQLIKIYNSLVPLKEYSMLKY